MAETDKNGEVKEAGKKKKQKARVVVNTELELKAVPPPTNNKGDAMRGWKVVAAKDIKQGEELGFTYEYNKAGAVLNVAAEKGLFSVSRLDQAVSPDKLMADVLSQGPDFLKELVARVNANAHLAPNAPKAGHKK